MKSLKRNKPEHEMDRETTYSAEWIGQDGHRWREVSYWVGNGYKTFLQRFIDGAWMGW
jgi:hypothetical protein